eukprot:CAMPEP_0204038906 /NCGR_PEP_ID=MMETSP0360-20130528/89322_1 /ASSEMBLY_ACC=CAM_ASM_000342 /TAXON_ID=268821 /ORGANISM="Scrippsiella Hangoei, Strain SHTV-5" /LENGTH=85 /DNA_ID=CAMNT_0050984705 /DNA_START=24 /DNA_END=279 /DNA_ORIENTATION=-
MVRGHAKEEAQAKNAAKLASSKKSGSQLEAREKGLKMVCLSCKLPMTNYKCLVQHYESKHPKETCPAEADFPNELPGGMPLVGSR